MVTEGGVELRQGAGERALSVGAGYRQDGACRCGECESLGCGESAGAPHLGWQQRLDHVIGHKDLHQGVRRVGRHTATGR